MNCCFGDFGGFFVAYVRADGSDDSDTVFHQITTMVFVSGNSYNTVVYEGINRISQCIDGLEQTIEYDRAVHQPRLVQLSLSRVYVP